MRRIATLALATSVALLTAASSASAVPVADFSMEWSNPPTRPSVGQVVSFNGTVEWDGVEGTVGWSFGEEGATGTGLTATYAYTTPGLKFVTMTATNGDTPPESSVPVTKLINVNSPPVAGFGWAPASPIAGQDVRFASESDDADGTIVEYDWDFGDGVTDERRNPEHPFATSGTKTVTLTVTDAYGAKSTETRDVVVQDPPVQGPPPNRPPIANFAFGPRSPQVGDPVEFVSSAVDPEGNLRSQAWDLDGDGQFDDARGDEVLYTFATPGEKTVRLRVEDTADGAAVRERTITVESAPKAKAGFLTPAPVVTLNGEILSSGMRVKVLSVRAPRGALVVVKCQGKGCGVERRRKRAKQAPVRFRSYQRFLRAGAKLEIFVRKANTIGDYTRYAIRAGKFPVRTDRCLPVGKDKPARSCA